MNEVVTKKPRSAFFKKYFGRILTVRGITELGVLIAFAIIFDQPFLKVRFGEGASLSLTMVPLFIIALRYPLIDSFLGIGVVYGFITMLLDNYGIASYPLDYLLGYGSIALAALFQGLIFKKRQTPLLNYVFLVLAIISGVSVRIWWSTLNGMLLWETPFWGSLVYNGTPMAGSAIIVIVMLTMLYPTLLLYHNKMQPQAETSDEDEQ